MSSPSAGQLAVVMVGSALLAIAAGASPDNADLALSKTNSPNAVARGARLTYTLTASNLGPAAATNVVVTDTLPPGVSFTDEPQPRPASLIFADGFESGDTLGWSLQTPAASCGRSGNVVTCTLSSLASGAGAAFVLHPKVSMSASGSLTNQGLISGAEADPVTSNNASSAVATVQVAPIDLVLSLHDAPDPVAPGGTLTYTATVINVGPATATFVTFSDPLPPELSVLSVVPSQGSCGGGSKVSCMLGTLLPGEGGTIVIRTAVSGSASGAITNTASVVGLETEPDLVDNTDTAITTVATRVRRP